LVPGHLPKVETIYRLEKTLVSGSIKGGTIEKMGKHGGKEGGKKKKMLGEMPLPV